MTEIIPDAPAWLDQTARRRWDELWRAVDRERVRPEEHNDIAAIYCVAFASFVDALENINSTGTVVKSGEKTITNPYVAVRDRNAKLMLKLAWELGLAPGSGSISWPTR